MSAVIVMFDCTDTDSFCTAQLMLEETKKYTSEDTLVTLVGNKCDLQRRVEREGGEAVGKAWGIQYFDVSVKEDWGVEAVLEHLGKELKARWREKAEKFAAEMEKQG